MDPQERTNPHPVLEYRVLKYPRGRSLVLGLARSVVIRGWVRRRNPFVDVLSYLRPWTEDSVSTTDAMRVEITNTLLPLPHALLPPCRPTSAA